MAFELTIALLTLFWNLWNVECGEKVFYVVHSCSGGSQYN